MNLTKVLSTDFNGLKQRIIKILRLGNTDVQTAKEASSYGVDSNPIAEMRAIYARTSDNSETFIIGYINKNQLAAVGEMRLYSTDANGALKFYTWLKNDGTYEMGGNADNAVRYAKLNTALEEEVNKINTELGKIATAIAAVGGTYTVAPVSVDISAAKIDEIKTL